MLRRAAFDFLNHLLQAEGWALARLKPFAGQHARFELGPLAQSFVVAGDGSLHACNESASAAVTVRLPDDAPLRLIKDQASLFGSARIAGSADFAEALGFVARNLRWDVEADLARAIGDIAAHRVVGSGRRVAAGLTDGLQRFAANLGEFAGEERAPVVATAESTAFRLDLARLSEEMARLEARIARLR